MRNKRGEIGEIILTVVIFALLTSLGIAAATNLVTRRLIHESDCTGIEIKLEKIKGNESLHDICGDSTYTYMPLRFKLVNAGIKPLNGLSINMIGKRGNQNIFITENIDAGSSKEFSINYDKLRNSELEKIYIVPVHSRINASCYEHMYETDDIGGC